MFGALRPLSVRLVIPALWASGGRRHFTHSKVICRFCTSRRNGGAGAVRAEDVGVIAARIANRYLAQRAADEGDDEGNEEGAAAHCKGSPA